MQVLNESLKEKKRSYDLVEYDCIYKIGFWIIIEEEMELEHRVMKEEVCGEDTIQTIVQG